MIQFLNLNSAYNELKEELEEATLSVLRSGKYILGESVEAFEEDWATYCQSRFCIGVANGLDALYLSLKVMGIGAGDEVLVPANTYIATWLAVTKAGASPIPVPPDPKTYNIDVTKIEKYINKKTKCIIPVHLYGKPCQIDEILSICNRYGLKCIEDAAQAHGANYGSRKIGSHSELVCWSFYPGKNLGAYGDGGAITTDCREYYDKLRMMRNYGSKERYKHDILGENSRLDSVQANILRVKLKYLDEWNDRRAKIARYYGKELSGTRLTLPNDELDEQKSWHLYVVRSEQRNRLQEHLFKNNVETLIHYPTPPFSQQAYAGAANFDNDQTQISLKFSNEILSIPIGPHLSEMEKELIADIIRKFSA